MINERVLKHFSGVCLSPSSFGSLMSKSTLLLVFQFGRCIYLTIEHAQFPSTPVEFPSCVPDLMVHCSAKCDSVDVMEVLGDGEVGLIHDLSKASFWILYLIFMVNWCAMALTFTLTDTICFDLLGQ